MPTPDQLVNESIVFSDAVLEATRNFARSRPWRGDVDLRAAKFREFHEALCMGTGPALVIDVPDLETNSSDSFFNQEMNAIELRGKLSVVTYLFLYFTAQALEDVQREAFDGIEPMVKAMTLFKKVFPNSYAKLRPGDGLFVSCGLHRNAPQPPVATPSNAPVGGTETEVPPATQVVAPPRP
jgi:hypothetical protein